MSADRLREAAALLRERAEAATPGPWRLEPPTPPIKYTIYEGHVRSDGMADGFDDTIGKTLDHADAAYIALMAPPVALALADWLDAYAARIEDIHESLPFSAQLTLSSLNITALDEALTVADAILGDRP